MNRTHLALHDDPEGEGGGGCDVGVVVLHHVQRGGGEEVLQITILHISYFVYCHHPPPPHCKEI